MTHTVVKDKIGDKGRMPILTTLFSLLEVLASKIRPERETKGIQVGKKEIMLPYSQIR
jgi:hypothetical protein